MKFKLLLLLSTFLVVLPSISLQSQNIGINADPPQAQLHVDGSFLVTGDTSSTPVSGSGTRLMWVPLKKAFRAGTVDGTQWDDINIKEYSFAFGENNISDYYSFSFGIENDASESYSFAFGSNNTADGLYSMAFGNSNAVSHFYSLAIGQGNTSSGAHSVAIGSSNNASGNNATAFGAQNTTSGYFSFAAGRNNTAQSYGSAVFGLYNEISGTTDSWISTDPLFIIGNGADDANRNNAVTVYKNGNTEIDGNLDITGTFTGDGSGLSNLQHDGDWIESNDSLFRVVGTDTIFTIANDGKVGVGVVSPNHQMQLSGSLAIPGTTGADVGVIHKGGSRFIHTYASPGTHGNNLFIGHSAGNFTTSASSYFGSYNVGVGNNVFHSFTTGFENAALGHDALSSNTSGHYNVAVGSRALNSNQTGHHNIAIGAYCYNSEFDASYNIAIGTGAMNGDVGSHNIAIGKNALGGNFEGMNNISIGESSGMNLEDGSNNIMIGYAVDVPSSTGVDQLNIGNTIYGNMGFDRVGIGVPSPAETLELNGAIRLANTGNNNSGTIRWTGTDFEGFNGSSWKSLTVEADNDWTESANYVYNVSDSVGIGNSSPLAKFHVEDGGILATGTTGSTPVSFSGTRFMWIPAKKALRAGEIVGSGWDNSMVGSHSVAFGMGTIAYGQYSFAVGNEASAGGIAAAAFGGAEGNGDYSGAFGLGSATGDYSLVHGYLSSTYGEASFASGYHTTAHGDYSASLGYFATSTPYASLAMGRYNEVSGTTGSWVSTDPLFIIGNGTDDANRNNAVTVYKNGNTEIDGNLDITGTFTGDASGLTNIPYDNDWTISNDSAYRIVGADTLVKISETGDLEIEGILTGDGSGLTNLPNDGDWTVSGDHVYNTDDSIGVGTSTPLSKFHIDGGGILATGTSGSTPISGVGTRFMWIPAQKAVRAGSVTGSQWHHSLIGNHSSAFGLDLRADGDFSFVAGNSSTVMGTATFSAGSYNLAAGDYAATLGYNNHAVGDRSIAIGNATWAESYSSITIGRYNSYSGNRTTWVDTDQLFVIGNGTDDANRNSAFTVYKNGNTEIDGDLDITGIFTGDASGLTNIPYDNDWTISNDSAYRIVGVDTLVKISETGDLEIKGILTGDGSGLTNLSADDDWQVSGDVVYNLNDSIGLGTSSPEQQLEITGSVEMPATTSSSTGIIFKDGNRFIHNYKPASANGDNLFIGKNSGNFTMSSNSYFSSANVGVGSNTLDAVSSGFENVAVGAYALSSNTMGHMNSAVGHWSQKNNENGIGNSSLGWKALIYNESGSYNTAVGRESGPGSGSTSLTNTGAFGYGAVPTASNRIHIGNTSVGWIGGQVSWATYSDERYKRNVREDVAGLDFILKLRPVTYQWDVREMSSHLGAKLDGLEDAVREQESKTYSGFMAQEVEEAANGSGFNFSGVQAPPNDKSLYSLSYGEFVVPLVKAVQEQQSMIEHQNAIIEELRKEVEDLKEKIE